MESNEFSENTNLQFAIDKGFNETNDEFQAVALLDEVKKLYPEMIREEICSIRMYQTKAKCYLEIAEDKIRVKTNIEEDDELIPEEYKNYSLIDRIIRRDDLEHIVGEDGPLFKPVHKVEYNSRLFMESIEDVESCLNSFNQIFSEEGIKILEERINLSSHD
jgi:hypothetical protein